MEAGGGYLSSDGEEIQMKLKKPENKEDENYDKWKHQVIGEV